MDKHRLELFSDGIFAILLTLLVLDLKIPQTGGLSGLLESWPGLAIHTLIFFFLGMVWILHHNALAGAGRISHLTLFLNLAALFWPTLMPYFGRIASERPFDPLSAALLCLAAAGYLLSISALRLSFQLEREFDPVVSKLRRRRIRWTAINGLAALVAAGLCWASPLVGYAFLLTSLQAVFLRPVAVVGMEKADTTV